MCGNNLTVCCRGAEGAVAAIEEVLPRRGHVLKSDERLGAKVSGRREQVHCGELLIHVLRFC